MGDLERSSTVPSVQAEAVASNHGPLPEVMGLEEAAKFLCVSTRTLDRYVRASAVPYTPLPRRGARVRVVFLRSQLMAWLRHRTVKPDQGNIRSIRA